MISKMKYELVLFWCIKYLNLKYRNIVLEVKICIKLFIICMLFNIFRLVNRLEFFFEINCFFNDMNYC